jgi:hypothetical protein
MVTVAIALIYLVAQQALRLAANDLPRLQAQDAVTRLNAGNSPRVAVTQSTVELADPGATFTQVYDETNHLVATSAVLGGEVVVVPEGVLAEARARGEDRVTWQPAPGVRLASVARPWRGGVVVSGRSLAPTEQQIDQIRGLCVMAWLGALAVALLTTGAALRVLEPRP